MPILCEAYNEQGKVFAYAVLNDNSEEDTIFGNRKLYDNNHLEGEK